jgi:hypothetical protein
MKCTCAVDVQVCDDGTFYQIGKEDPRFLNGG